MKRCLLALLALFACGAATVPPPPTQAAPPQEHLPYVAAAQLRPRLFRLSPASSRLEAVERAVLLRDAFAPALSGEVAQLACAAPSQRAAAPSHRG